MQSAMYFKIRKSSSADFKHVVTLYNIYEVVQTPKT